MLNKGTLASVSKDNKLLTSHKTAEIKIFFLIFCLSWSGRPKNLRTYGFGTLHRTNNTIPHWVRESHYSLGDRKSHVFRPCTVPYMQKLGMICYFTIMYHSSAFGSETIVRDICSSACYPIHRFFFYHKVTSPISFRLSPHTVSILGDNPIILPPYLECTSNQNPCSAKRASAKQNLSEEIPCDSYFRYMEKDTGMVNFKDLFCTIVLRQ